MTELELPAGWEWTKLKFVAGINMGQAPPSEVVNAEEDGLPFLQGAAEFGVVSPQARLWCTASAKVCQPKDLLMSVRAPVGALNLADRSFGIGRGLCALTPTRLRPRYLWHALSFLVERLAGIGQGSTYGAVTKREVANASVPLPPDADQVRIGEFLDVELARLDAIIERCERLLFLLGERKRRLISRLVGEGLGADVERKDAGEDGLRRMPAHWEVKRLKRVTPRIQVGIVIRPARYYVEAPGTPALRGLNIRPGIISDHELVYLSEEGHLINRKSELRAGDVVVVRTGAAGAAAVVPGWADGFNAVDLLIVRRAGGIRSKFLEYLINSDYAIDQVAKFSVGSLQAHFNVGALKQLLIALPPQEEQDELLAYLNPRVAHLDLLVERMRTYLQLTIERRHAVLTAAVTGKLDEAEGALAA